MNELLLRKYSKSIIHRILISAASPEQVNHLLHGKKLRSIKFHLYLCTLDVITSSTITTDDSIYFTYII